MALIGTNGCPLYVLDGGRHKLRNSENMYQLSTTAIGDETQHSLNQILNGFVGIARHVNQSLEQRMAP